MTSTMSLYHIGEELRRLEEAMVESGGENTPDVEAAFAALGELEAWKVDGYRAVITTFDAHAQNCKAEASILTEKAKAAENVVKRLKDRLKLYMEERGVTELKGHIFRAALQKNGGKQAVTLLVEPKMLPPGLQHVTIAADAERIRAIAKDGKVVFDGVEVARVEPVGTHVRFR